MNRWIRSRFTPNLPLYRNKERVTESPEHIRVSLEAAMESMVLLKNEDNVLPLKKGCRVVLFGKGSCDYVKGGEGSGIVNSSYSRSLADALSENPEMLCVFPDTIAFYRENLRGQYAEGHIPGLTYEPELPEELADRAREFSDTAIISICRTSGEGWDAQSEHDHAKEVEACNQWMADIAAELFPEGCFYLSDAEKKMIETVCGRFPKVIVNLNVGSIIDTSWIRDEDRIQASIISWQGGQEGGLALARILVGDDSPSGHLADTIPMHLSDIPSTEHFHDDDYSVDCTEDIYVGYRYFETIPGARKKVCYPFGYGLSYTTFQIAEPEVHICETDGKTEVSVTVKVINTGHFSGRDVIQIYLEAPQGLLGKARRVLTGYQKTKLLAAGQHELVRISFILEDYASYDDEGAVQKSAYILERGTYRFYVGHDVENTLQCSEYLTLPENKIVRQLTERLKPYQLRKRLLADGTYKELIVQPYPEEEEHGFPRQSSEEMEAIVPESRKRNRYKLSERPCGNPALDDVADGKVSLSSFISKLPDEYLADLLGGQPNTGVASSFGAGNIPEFGVPDIMFSDGPSGVNIQKQAMVTTTSFPCCTALACTWNPAITYKVGLAGSEELLENNLSLWLTPAVNIHRNPMCGRNFEYYSEDPLLTAKQAGSLIRGVQHNHAAASVKHFALNVKETQRKVSDTRVSERAAREIYLKQFEYIIREADPWVVMCSYNKINGIRAGENRDLLTGILREEWGYQGLIITDWWTSGEQYREILAGVDLKMGCGFPERLLEAKKRNLISRNDMEKAAAYVLGFILRCAEAPLYLQNETATTNGRELS